MYSFDKEFYQVAGVGVVNGLAIASQIPYIINNGYDPVCGSIIAANTCSLIGTSTRVMFKYKKWKRLHDIMQKDEFLEHKELYKELVDDIALFFKEIGISNDLECAFFSKLCIDSGIFSESDLIEFVSYKDDNCDHFVDMMGARITTGNFCCRHIASLTTDIINRMGGVAADISVCRMTEGEKESIYPNHLITGLVHDNKKVLFEASLPMVCYPLSGVVNFSTKKGQIMTKSMNGFIYKERSSDFEAEKINRENLKIIKSLDDFVLEDDLSVIEEYTMAFSTYLKNGYELVEFREQEMPKIKRLAKLNRIITPHYVKDSVE